MKLRWYGLLGVAAGLMFVLAVPAVVEALEIQPKDEIWEGVPEVDDPNGEGLVCGTWHWIFPLRWFCKTEHIDNIDGPYRPCTNIQIGGKWWHIESVWPWITWVRRVYDYQQPIG